MTTPLPTTAQRVRHNADLLVDAAQLAAGWDVPIKSMWVDPDSVHVHVGTVEGGRRLARVLNLDVEEVDAHPHGSGVKVAVRWRAYGSVVSVSFVQQAVSVAAAVA